jgi:hypothetical protein
MARNRLQFDINAKDKTKRAFSSLKRGLKGVSKAVFNMKTGLAAVAGVTGLGLLIRNSLQSIDKLGKLSRQVFISTERLGAFRLSAELGGTSIEAFAKGVRTMAVGISDWLTKGTGIAQDAFIQLGITQEDLRATNGDLFSQFELVADALRKMEDGTDKTAAAYKLFGGRNIELLTAIENGTMGMEEQFQMAKRLGLVMSKDVVGTVEQANDSMAMLKLGVVGLSQQFSAALAPAILRVSDNLREKFLLWVEKSHGSITGFGNYLANELVESLGKFAEIMIHITEATINTAIAMGNLGVAAANVVEFFKWKPEYQEFHDFVDISDEKIKKLKETLSSLTGSGEEDTIGKIFNSKELEDARNRIEAREKEIRDNKLKEEQEAIKKHLDMEAEKFHKRQQMIEENAKKEREIRARAKTDIKSNLEGTLTILSGHSEKAFKMLKAHKISEAIVNTYSAVMKAFATVPYPLNYLAAGSALAFGMAQVQQIRAQKFTARRQGGIVSENKPYMVGEGGPETFIPNSAGTIVPSGSGGQAVNVNFTINAVDTTGFQQLLSNERGTIIGMINSAVNQQGKSNLI